MTHRSPDDFEALTPEGPATMTIDDVLRILAPLTPAVLPVIVFVWHRTRQELHGIRQELRDMHRELTELRRQPLLPDTRLDYLTTAIDGIGVEMERIAEAERHNSRMLAARESAAPLVERSPP